MKRGRRSKGLMPGPLEFPSWELPGKTVVLMWLGTDAEYDERNKRR